MLSPSLGGCDGERDKGGTGQIGRQVGKTATDKTGASSETGKTGQVTVNVQLKDLPAVSRLVPTGQ